MKNQRQLAIISIINENPIKTHEQIVTELEKRGFSVTQATVSRDIKDLCLIKRPDGVYAVSDGVSKSSINAFSDSVCSVEYSGNLIVIKTTPGTASAVAAFADCNVSDDILGSIAGDDTIFIAVKNAENIKSTVSDLKAILGI